MFGLKCLLRQKVQSLKSTQTFQMLLYEKKYSVSTTTILYRKMNSSANKRKVKRVLLLVLRSQMERHNIF